MGNSKAIIAILQCYNVAMTINMLCYGKFSFYLWHLMAFLMLGVSALLREMQIWMRYQKSSGNLYRKKFFRRKHSKQTLSIPDQIRSLPKLWHSWQRMRQSLVGRCTPSWAGCSWSGSQCRLGRRWSQRWARWSPWTAGTKRSSSWLHGFAQT